MKKFTLSLAAVLAVHSQAFAITEVKCSGSTASGSVNYVLTSNTPTIGFHTGEATPPELTFTVYGQSNRVGTYNYTREDKVIMTDLVRFAEISGSTSPGTFSQDPTSIRLDEKGEALPDDWGVSESYSGYRTFKAKVQSAIIPEGEAIVSCYKTVTQAATLDEAKDYLNR